MRTDRSEHTQGRSEGEQRCSKFPGKVGNDISISIRSDLEVGGGWPCDLRGEAWTAQIEMKMQIILTLQGGNESVCVCVCD